MIRAIKGGCNARHPIAYQMSRPLGLPNYVLLVTRSEGEFCIDGDNFSARPGCAVLLAPNTPYSYGNPKGEYMDDWLHFAVDDPALDQKLGEIANQVFPLEDSRIFSWCIDQIIWEATYSPPEMAGDNTPGCGLLKSFSWLFRLKRLVFQLFALLQCARQYGIICKVKNDRRIPMENCRTNWLSAMLKIVSPVLDALEKGELKTSLPLGFHPDRADFAPLEAFGRSLLGLAPWLELEGLEGEEARLQSRYREKALHCLAMASDPASPDFMNFCRGGQPLVDAAFLAHALVRAPNSLAGSLPERARRDLVSALISSRQITACNTNWLFFTAMVEAGLSVLGEKPDMTRVIYALRAFQGWYKGDGIYGDGEAFHWDYYNSFVIQPMYVDLVKLFAEENEEIAAMKPTVMARAARYASVLERMIAPDGSYPVVGRSVCYRFGAFQLLAQAALEHFLEPGLSPAAVRCGLSAVIGRVMSAPDMFDEKGWLLPGVYGHQPELAEGYINTGSLYLCSGVFLPLGLAPSDAFWAGPDEDWTEKKLWSGGHVSIDHAID